MNLLSLSNISLNLGGRVLFSGLSWGINQGERSGLIGANGAGKSSLLKAICQALPLEQGTRWALPGLTIGYLPQQVSFPAGRSLLELAEELPPRLAQVVAALDEIEARLGDPAVYNDSRKLTQALNEQEKLLVKYELLEVEKYPARVRAALGGLGIPSEDYNLPGEGLSGGQKKLVALARLILEKPDLLLLDEPDNHLDLEGKRFLERFIREYAGAVVIVSHDRYLLDEVAGQIVELENGALNFYPGNYSAYKTERELRRLRQEQQYVTQQKEIARIQAAIQRFELWASLVVNERHIKQARSRQKMLARMEADGEMIAPISHQKLMDIRLAGGRGSTKAIELDGVGIGFGGEWLFRGMELVLYHGQRLGLVGPNGAGKSVLAKIILGELAPLEGEVKIGPSTRIGYYAQEHQSLAEWWERTPIELVRHTRPVSENAAVAQLLKFAFTYDQTRAPIRTLSGGERSRLQLLAIMLQQPNCLVLDEPTNNLDIASMEVLEAALDEFDGALVIISHDRYFLDQSVDQTVELDNGTIAFYPGGYTDYILARTARMPE